MANKMLFFAFLVVSVAQIRAQGEESPANSTSPPERIPLPNRCAFKLPQDKDAFLASLNSIMQGTIWTMESRYEEQLGKGSITIKDKHYIVKNLDSTLGEIFSSAPTTFKTGTFHNDQSSIFRDAKTLRTALQSALKETTAKSLEIGIIMEALKQVRYLREELFFHRYMPLIFLSNAICIGYFILAKICSKVKQIREKQRLQQAIQMRQERELLVQQLRA